MAAQMRHFREVLDKNKSKLYNFCSARFTPPNLRFARSYRDALLLGAPLGSEARART